MKYDTFDRLATLLCPYIIKSSGKKQTSRNYRHNGAILPEIRLACALHCIFGGPIHDVMACETGVSNVIMKKMFAIYVLKSDLRS
jgi:hypothetical protein